MGLLDYERYILRAVTDAEFITRRFCREQGDEIGALLSMPLFRYLTPTKTSLL